MSKSDESTILALERPTTLYDEVSRKPDGSYSLRGITYHKNFPVSWAINHKQDTGPEDCLNCSSYGYCNEVFIGYCSSCAIWKYKGARGRGFMGEGVEFSWDDFNNIFQSAYTSYLAESNDECESVEYNEDDYLNADPYSDSGSFGNDEISGLDCHFDGGYNDF